MSFGYTAIIQVSSTGILSLSFFLSSILSLAFCKSGSIIVHWFWLGRVNFLRDSWYGAVFLVLKIVLIIQRCYSYC